MVVSLWSGASLEEIANVTPNGLRWLNITPMLSDRNLVKQILKRAEITGYKGIFVTLDRQVSVKKRTPAIVNKFYRRAPIV